jgi:predicted small secreted protein
MKIALLLSIACAALMVTGCSTSQGGAEDTYESSSGGAQQNAIAPTDPSLPQDPNIGPQIVPP